MVQQFLSAERKDPHGILGFPGGSVVKNPPANAGTTMRYRFDPWVGKIPWRKVWQPTAVFLTQESHGLRSLAGHSQKGQRVGHDWATKQTSVYPRPRLMASIVDIFLEKTVAVWPTFSLCCSASWPNLVLPCEARHAMVSSLLLGNVSNHSTLSMALLLASPCCHSVTSVKSCG